MLVGRVPSRGVTCFVINLKRRVRGPGLHLLVYVFSAPSVTQSCALLYLSKSSRAAQIFRSAAVCGAPTAARRSFQEQRSAAGSSTTAALRFGCDSAALRCICPNRRRPRESPLLVVVLVLVIGNGAVEDEDDLLPPVFKRGSLWKTDGTSVRVLRA